MAIKAELDAVEQQRFSALACRSGDGLRRKGEGLAGHRQLFAQDADRILHSKAYTRYIDKTQVFSLIDNDHITHRVLHVQIVSRIARTISRFLGLNEDLVEAIALGHDIGHPPFGHEGERILSRICRQHGLASFQHNIQSVQFLDRLERQGKGWNLTLQVLDGILCHDGEIHTEKLQPDRQKDFARLDREILAKQADPGLQLRPMTLEGCVVRMADTIGYIGRDIEDAIELKLIAREDIPGRCSELLGNSNGTMVYTLVADLISSSHQVRTAGRPGGDGDCIGFSQPIAQGLLELKQFNYQHIYANPGFKPDFDLIHDCYEQLFSHYLQQTLAGRTPMNAPPAALSGKGLVPGDVQAAAVVRDYLAGMTDEYFLRKAKEIGCETPERKCLPN